MSFLRSLSSKVSAYQNAAYSPPPEAHVVGQGVALPPPLSLTEAVGSQAVEEPQCARNGRSGEKQMEAGAAGGSGPGGVEGKESVEQKLAPFAACSEGFSSSTRSRSVKRAADATLTYRDLWLQP